MPPGETRRALRDAALRLALRLTSIDDDLLPPQLRREAAKHGHVAPQFIADASSTGEELATLCVISAKTTLGIDAAIRSAHHLERGARRRYLPAKLGMHVLLEVSRHQYGCLMLLRCFAQPGFASPLAAGMTMPLAAERTSAAVVLAERADTDNDAKFVVGELLTLVRRLSTAAQRVSDAPKSDNAMWQLHIATLVLGSRSAVGKAMPQLGASDVIAPIVDWLTRRATQQLMRVPPLSPPSVLAAETREQLDAEHRAHTSAHDTVASDLRRMARAARLVDDDFMPADAVAGLRPNYNTVVNGLPPLTQDALELDELSFAISFRERTRADVQRQADFVKMQRYNDNRVRQNATRRAAGATSRITSTHVDQF